MTSDASAQPDTLPDGHDQDKDWGPAHHGGQDRRPARRRQEATHAGSEQAVVKQHAKGKLTARERIERLLDPGSFDRVRRVRPAPGHRLRRRREPAVRGRRGHRARHRRRPPRRRVQPGLHRLRRIARRGLRRQDRQGDGPRAEDGLPAHRHQRRRRGANPGRRGRARAVRRDLLPERDGLRGDPADLADHGPVRGRRGLLPRHHRLHADGGGHLAHVHHRPGCDQDGDRGGGDVRGTRRGARAQRPVRRRALPGQGRGRLHRVRPRTAVLPAVQQPRRPAGHRRPRRPRRGGRGHQPTTRRWTR